MNKNINFISHIILKNFQLSKGEYPSVITDAEAYTKTVHSDYVAVWWERLMRSRLWPIYKPFNRTAPPPKKKHYSLFGIYMKYTLI